MEWKGGGKWIKEGECGGGELKPTIQHGHAPVITIVTQMLSLSSVKSR